MIDRAHEVTFSLIFTLGTMVSLDSMMIILMGRSIEKCRIKNKPINEGHTLFVLATKDGFVANFTPDWRTTEKKPSKNMVAWKNRVRLR